MAHYVITLDGLEYVTSAWSEQDAIEAAYDKAGKDWESVYDMPVDAIRPATVREALTAEYGDNAADENYAGMSHVYDVVNTYRTDGKDVLVIRAARANDMHGYDDAVDVSNYRVLYDNWKGLDGLITSTWSNVDSIGLLLDSEAPADLTDFIDSLSDYPVIDEQEWSNVEQEMIQEHWDSYGRSDTKRAVEEALGDDVELTDAGLEIIDRLTFEGILDYGCGGGYPTFIDASAAEFGTEDVAKFFAENVGTVVKFDRHGMAVELDLTRNNIVAV